MAVLSDIEIARSADKRPIADIAAKLGLEIQDILPYGHDKAKIAGETLARLSDETQARLILVTAINPTPAGEGKTTTTVGLADGLNRIGKRAVVAIREASLGPCFGAKGGAAGGGYAQIVPMDDMNLHFTGDFHAITAAHNLLAALIDNHIYWGNKLDIDTRRIVFRRVLDMNDRALRQIVSSLGGIANGFVRESGFDITVASEVMAILCLAENLDDLTARLGSIVIGYNRSREAIYARDLHAQGPMSVLLKDAMLPNLVQTLENNPAFVHGGPFANIAHGCSSLIATKTALKLADYVVTEAGFGADLGAEKFFDIKCRKGGLKPAAAVLVATIRALKMNGGVSGQDLAQENIDALKKGTVNLLRHLDNIRSFGVPVVVGVNCFSTDSQAEFDVLRDLVEKNGHKAILCRHWELGSKGIEELAHEVVNLSEQPADFRLLYPDSMPLAEKIDRIVTRIYRGRAAVMSDKIRRELEGFERAGFGHLPICMAKTQYSFTTNPDIRGAPEDFDVPVREVRLCAGAGFIVAICGDIMTMPGLPSKPNAENIYLNNQGEIEGLS